MKISKIITTTSLIASLASSGLSAFATDDDITVKINDNEIDFAKYGNVLPYIENDFTLIPIRPIAESLNLEVSWDESTRTVEIGVTVLIFG